MLAVQLLVLFHLFALLALALASPTLRSLPIVDLEYALHQGTINETGRYYMFSNIRYAAPPVGNLRFAAPTAPAVNLSLNDGQKGVICPQAYPFWEYLAVSFLGDPDTEKLRTVEERVEALEASLTTDTISTHAPIGPQTSEDCLFLDVFVPEDIFNQKKKPAPVMVWIHGGGYVGGDKTSAGNPATLIAKSQENDRDGMIYVSMNYRLGLFGWMSGSKFVSEGGLPNAGLFDQRFALEWVHKYIHLFGGDPSRVTVIGESAGGGSIMHHLTAWGSTQKAPFQQAVLQSPGFTPVIGNAQQDAIHQSVLSQAQDLISENVNSTADLRELEFTKLAALNNIIVARSKPYGTFTFGPVVDGNYVPKLPGTLMKEGRHASSVNVITAHNLDEGLIFTSPFISEDLIKDSLVSLFPAASNATVSHALTEIWPAIYNGSYPYTNTAQRAGLAISEITFNCNSRYTALTYSDAAYSYIFAIPPGYHGADVAYTYFNGDSSVLNATIADIMQSYITNFVQTGTPNGAGLSNFPRYGPNNSVSVFSDSAIDKVQRDISANDRCAWLQSSPLGS